MSLKVAFVCVNFFVLFCFCFTFFFLNCPFCAVLRPKDCKLPDRVGDSGSLKNAGKLWEFS